MNKVTQTLAVCLMVFAASNVTYAQQEGATTIIDGSKNPELISDSLAYRLYLLGVTSLPTSPTNLQQAQLKVAGLAPADIQASGQILAVFRASYDSLSDSYNRQVENSDATGAQPDANLFAVQRDAIVANTRAALQKALSSVGMEALNAHVQRE